MDNAANRHQDLVDLLSSRLWHRIFGYLLLPQGCPPPEDPGVRARRKKPWSLTASMQRPAGRDLLVKFVDPDFTAVGQHRHNADTYGSGWPLLCCAMASKRLLVHVLSFSKSHPIALVYNDLHPQWMKSINHFLRWDGLKSLDIIFTHIMQLDTIRRWRLSSLTSLSLKLRGALDTDQLYDEVEEEDQDEADENLWSVYYDCPDLKNLKLGRGKWSLDTYDGLRSLTLKHVDSHFMNFKLLAEITLQLHDFTLYESSSLKNQCYSSGYGGGSFCFDLSNARTVRFRFGQSSLTLFLTFSPCLKTFSAVTKSLVLSCKSSSPLDLHHLSLYAQEKVVVSSLPVVSAKVVYLNGPATVTQCNEDNYRSHWDTNPPPGDWEQLFCNSSDFSWTTWLATIAPTVEVLIVRHGIPIQEVDAEWSSLCSLGFVVEFDELYDELHVKSERRREGDTFEHEATVEEAYKHNQKVMNLQLQKRHEEQRRLREWEERQLREEDPRWQQQQEQRRQQQEEQRRQLEEQRRQQEQQRLQEWQRQEEQQRQQEQQLPLRLRRQRERARLRTRPRGHLHTVAARRYSLPQEPELTPEEKEQRQQQRQEQYERRRQQWEQERKQEEEQQQQEQQLLQKKQQQEDADMQAGKPPLIRAPNLRAMFFPTRTVCDKHTLASLRQVYCPSLALYCIVGRSFYWERKGQKRLEGPEEHVRKGRSGVSCNGFGERIAKRVREKMHGVNRELVEGYALHEDDAYIMKHEGRKR